MGVGADVGAGVAVSGPGVAGGVEACGPSEGADEAPGVGEGPSEGEGVGVGVGEGDGEGGGVCRAQAG